jgi:hypothetical protein
VQFEFCIFSEFPNAVLTDEPHMNGGAFRAGFAHDLADGEAEPKRKICPLQVFSPELNVAAGVVTCTDAKPQMRIIDRSVDTSSRSMLVQHSSEKYA